MKDNKQNPNKQQNQQQRQAAPTQQKGQQRQASATPSKGGNSINFEKCDYDTKQHLLRAQFRQGANSILCCINEDVLTKLYHCSPSETELKNSFKQHQPEISRALLGKIARKEWKILNKEIHLEARDLQK
jgi:hypothetical protein